MLLRRWIIAIQAFILARPVQVMAVSAVFVAAALLAGTQVEFRTARSELSPSDDAEQARFNRLLEEFAGEDALIACIEAAPGNSATPAEMQAFADALAAALGNHPQVDQLFYRVDLEWFLERGLALAPPETLEQAVAAARGDSGLLEALAGARHLGDLNAALADRLESGLSGGGALPDAGARAAAAASLEGLAGLLRAEREFVEDSEGLLDGLEGSSPLLALAGPGQIPAAGGYVASRDGSLFFLMIIPRWDDPSLPVVRDFVGEMRRRARDVQAAHPGFAVAFTGQPATTVEEMDTVRRDTWFTAVVAATGVGLLTFLVFRWKSHALIVLATLGTGIAWAFGAVWLELGYLNLVTSAFISTLVGVGVAYSIHPVSEYEMEEAHTHNPREAVRTAFHRTGAGVAVSAVTTAAAFFSILLMEFPAFAELGLVAGVGVLLCLTAALITLPALLALHGHQRHRLEQNLGAPAGDTAPEGKRRDGRRSAMDRIWVDRGADLSGHYPRTVTVSALVLTGLLGWAAWGVGFNTNILDLLPENAESLRYERRMMMEADFSAVFNVVVADDLQQLSAMRDRALEEETIQRFDSALLFLPREPGRVTEALAELAGLLDDVRLPDSVTAPSREELAASFRRLESVLAEASEAAFGAGLGELAGPLESARAEAEAAAESTEQASAGAAAAWGAAQTRLLDWARGALADLRLSAAQEPPSPENLPSEVRERFITRNGRFLGYLQPAGSVFDPEFLDSYVTASRRVDSLSTGFPIVFHRMSARITDGFYRAVAGGAILVTLVLLIDTRSIRDTLLAILPLSMGVVWMLGGMRLLGLSYNFANLMAVPLIIGVGIDNGVHIIHRVHLEGDRGLRVVMRHTARAIIIASMTTMIGFGSLALASHRGLASLGLILLLGVGACLVTSTVVLPNLLLVLGILKK
jgi:predicted RND superfamily exporter protein